MRPLYFLSLVFIASLVLVGCRSSSKVVDAEADESVMADTSVAYTNAIHVLVDGKDRGVIPQTLRIRRSFGTQQISLWQHGKEIRIYELEISNTTAGDQMLQGFWSTPSAEGESYDVQNLPKSGELVYRIPYAPYPLRIDDNEYDVTLLVSE